MEWKTKTFEVVYKVFAPGEKVTPTSNRCPLERGQVYEVVSCHEIMHEQDTCIVFVKGRQTGVDTEYLESVPDEKAEITAALRGGYETTEKVVKRLVQEKTKLEVIALLDRVRYNTGDEDRLSILLDLTDRVEGFCTPGRDITRKSDV